MIILYLLLCIFLSIVAMDHEQEVREKRLWATRGEYSLSCDDPDHGTEVATNYLQNPLTRNQGRELLQKKADSGNRMAMHELSRDALKRNNPGLAFSWSQQSADQGYKPAQFDMFSRYKNTNINSAFPYLKKAIEPEEIRCRNTKKYYAQPEALIEAGNLYFTGNDTLNIKPDIDKAMTYWTVASFYDHSANKLLAQGFLSQKKFAEAKKIFERALVQDTTNSDIFLGLGQTYVGLRDYKNAIHCFDQAIKNNQKVGLQHIEQLALQDHVIEAYDYLISTFHKNRDEKAVIIQFTALMNDQGLTVEVKKASRAYVIFMENFKEFSPQAIIKLGNNLSDETTWKIIRQHLEKCDENPQVRWFLVQNALQKQEYDPRLKRLLDYSEQERDDHNVPLYRCAISGLKKLALETKNLQAFTTLCSWQMDQENGQKELQEFLQEIIQNYGSIPSQFVQNSEFLGLAKKTSKWQNAELSYLVADALMQSKEKSAQKPALKLMEQSAVLGSNSAQWRLVSYYDAKNEKKLRLQWLQKAITGQIAPENRGVAKNSIEKMAKEEDKEVVYFLKNLYSTGINGVIERDEKKSNHHLERAIELGYFVDVDCSKIAKAQLYFKTFECSRFANEAEKEEVQALVTDKLEALADKDLKVMCQLLIVYGKQYQADKTFIEKYEKNYHSNVEIHIQLIGTHKEKYKILLQKLAIAALVDKEICSEFFNLNCYDAVVAMQDKKLEKFLHAIVYYDTCHGNQVASEEMRQKAADYFEQKKHDATDQLKHLALTLYSSDSGKVAKALNLLYDKVQHLESNFVGLKSFQSNIMGKIMAHVEQYASQKNLVAAKILAIVYKEGITGCIEPNKDKVFKYVKIAADLNDPEMAVIAAQLYKEEGPRKSVVKVREYCESVIKNRDALTRFKELACSILRQLADAGDIRSYYSYMNALCSFPDKDPSLLKTYLQKSEDLIVNMNPQDQATYASYIVDSELLSTLRDYTKIVAPLNYDLGKLYLKRRAIGFGKGHAPTEKDRLFAAQHFFQKYLEGFEDKKGKDYVKLLVLMGDLYIDLGLFNEAEVTLSIAANIGNVKARLRLAELHLDGKAGLQGQNAANKALEYMKLAADSPEDKNGAAKFKYAQMLFTGPRCKLSCGGVIKCDQKEAQNYFQQSADQGHKEAARILNETISQIEILGETAENMKKRRSKELESNDPEVLSKVLFDVGRTLHGQGEFDEAYNHFERSRDLGSVPALIYMGIIKLDQGDYDKAYNAFCTALNESKPEDKTYLNACGGIEILADEDHKYVPALYMCAKLKLLQNDESGLDDIDNAHIELEKDETGLYKDVAEQTGIAEVLEKYVSDLPAEKKDFGLQILSDLYHVKYVQLTKASVPFARRIQVLDCALKHAESVKGKKTVEDAADLIELLKEAVLVCIDNNADSKATEYCKKLQKMIPTDPSVQHFLKLLKMNPLQKELASTAELERIAQSDKFSPDDKIQALDLLIKFYFKDKNYKKLSKYLNQGEKLGSSNAMAMKGAFLLKGECGFKKDEERAIALLDKANTFESNYRLATKFYDQGKFEDAFRVFTRLGPVEDFNIKCYLLRMYSHGQGTAQSISSAQNCLKTIVRDITISDNKLISDFWDHCKTLKIIPLPETVLSDNDSLIAYGQLLYSLSDHIKRSSEKESPWRVEYLKLASEAFNKVMNNQPNLDLKVEALDCLVILHMEENLTNLKSVCDSYIEIFKTVEETHQQHTYSNEKLQQIFGRYQSVVNFLQKKDEILYKELIKELKQFTYTYNLLIQHQLTAQKKAARLKQELEKRLNKKELRIVTLKV